MVDVCLAEIRAQHAHTAAIVANRCEPAEVTELTNRLARFGPKSYVLPESRSWVRRRSVICCGPCGAP